MNLVAYIAQIATHSELTQLLSEMDAELRTLHRRIADLEERWRAWQVHPGQEEMEAVCRAIASLTEPQT